MRFSQKALIYNRAEFDFGEKNLAVAVDDGRLKIGFSVPYHEIGTHRSIKSFPEKAVSHYGVSVLVGVIAAYGVTMNLDLTAGSMFIFCVFALLGLLLCFFAHYAHFDATRIPIASGNTILIFHDSQHPLILGEIYKRRKAELLRIYGEIDLLNHPQLEIKKFLWLKEEAVLSDAEFEDKRMKVIAAFKKNSGTG